MAKEDKLLPGKIQRSFRLFGETTKPGQAEWWGRVEAGREVKQCRGGLGRSTAWAGGQAGGTGWGRARQ